MVQTLSLGGDQQGSSGGQRNIRRLNRLPVIVGIIIAALSLAVIFYGLSTRGLYFRGDPGIEPASGTGPASPYADQLTRGVPDGIIGEPVETPLFQPVPPPREAEPSRQFGPGAEEPAPIERAVPQVEPEDAWRARIEREQEEQFLRERHRQRMARMQANDAAYDSPLVVSLGTLESGPIVGPGNESMADTRSGGSASDLYSAALRAGLTGQQVDPNRQADKEAFFNQDIRELGYLPNQVVPQFSPYELKRGSVIPATLITGVNSDLPGRIVAQVSQNVYDSATGRHLLIPQGARLFGRYDSNVSFGQRRVLVIWTDIIFPNGSTLQIGGMAGTDAQGYGGFRDRVNNHYLRTFGSAILLAIIGTGMDMAIPESSTLATQDTASDAARRNFAETFGRVTERTISRNLDVQPTLQIRPGYLFNVLVDQDLVFPGAYR